MEYQYNEESIFNMALAYLKRIDKLFYLSCMASMRGDVEGWLNALNALFRELSVRLTEDEIEELNGEDAELKDILNDLNGHSDFRSINKFCNSPEYKKKYRKQAMYLLSNLEIKIRGKMQKKGMLLPSKDDPRRAITKR